MGQRRPKPEEARSGYITKEGYARMSAEFEQLYRVERPKVVKGVAEAAAEGDRSENAEYIYGKKKLREIDRRIRFLERRLDRVTVVEPTKEQLDKVYFGAWFTLEDEDGKVSTYRIVGTDEIDLANRKISIASPVAQALLGKKVGETTTVLRPKGAIEVTVMKIWYETVPG